MAIVLSCFVAYGTCFICRWEVHVGLHTAIWLRINLHSHVWLPHAVLLSPQVLEIKISVIKYYQSYERRTFSNNFPEHFSKKEGFFYHKINVSYSSLQSITKLICRTSNEPKPGAAFCCKTRHISSLMYVFLCDGCEGSYDDDYPIEPM